MNKQGPVNVFNLKTIIKAKDMEDDMFNFIDRWARETFENKEKFRDETVINA